MGIGDGIDPRSLEEQEHSRAVAMAQRLKNKNNDEDRSANVVDGLSPVATVKIWKMDSLDEQGIPHIVSQFNIFNDSGKVEVPVECFCGLLQFLNTNRPFYVIFLMLICTTLF